MNKLDKHKYWLSVGLCVAGVALLFVGMLVNPVGVISGTVIGGAGEIFVLAGAILGIDTVYSHKLQEIVKDTLNGTKADERENK